MVHRRDTRVQDFEPLHPRLTNLPVVSWDIPNIAGGMQEWKYTFDPVSKEDWIRQIEADLRQKPLSSLQSTWWEGEILTPLVHADDISGEPIRLPDHFFNQPPIVTEYFNTKSVAPGLVNKKILEALQQGAQSIILHTDQSHRLSVDSWFAGVMEELVTLSIEPDKLIQESGTILSGGGPNKVLIRALRSDHSLALPDLLDVFNSPGNTMDALRFVYHFPSSGIWDIQTAAILNKLLDDLNSWIAAGLMAESFFAKCILSTEADPFYFKHIIQSRVLHLLWQNLRDHHGIDIIDHNGHYLECHIEQSDTENPDQFLIRASMSSLAASMAGTHALCIHHSELPDNELYYRRINRNIHHLLSLESGMYKGTDPLSGAFALDYHCRNWTKNIWDKLSLVK